MHLQYGFFWDRPVSCKVKLGKAVCSDHFADYGSNNKHCVKHLNAAKVHVDVNTRANTHAWSCYIRVLLQHRHLFCQPLASADPSRGTRSFGHVALYACAQLPTACLTCLLTLLPACSVWCSTSLAWHGPGTR